MINKILIVDDEESVLLLLSQAFAGHCEVLTASSGELALEVIKKDKPALVFLDIAMPGMTGLRVLELIQEMGLPPVVWMLTGDEDLEMAERTLKGGAKGYITKPFDVDRLRKVVFNALADLEKDKKHPGADEKPWRVKKDKK
ncbi:MAG: response regulator [Elusimicrobiales bacterium]|nr:response regulator [Elusimicrobiales bacterium]